MSKFGTLFKTPFAQVRKLARKKPVTAWCLVLVAVLLCAATIADNIGYNGPYLDGLTRSEWKKSSAYRFWDAVSLWANQTGGILFLFAFGAFFVESVFPKVKKGRKVLLLVPFLLLSTFLSCAGFGEEMVVFSGFFAPLEGPRTEYAIIAYAFILLSLSVYFCFRRAGKRFSKYTLDVFCECVLCAAVFFVTALGVLILSIMLEELLWDDASDYAEVPMILAGFLYPVAAALNALDGDGEEPPKFAVSAVKYVLLPLCAAAYVIVYVYIAKVLITWTFPSNSVFSILSALFIVSMPVALMCLDAEKKDLPHRAASLMPVLFIPLIGMQGLCMGMRVIQYGLTAERYLGLALMVFELVYTLWAVIKKGETQGTLAVIAAMLALALCLPAVSCVDLPVTLQNRTLRLAEVENLDLYSENRLSRIRAALNTIDSKRDEERDAYLLKHFDDAEREKIELLDKKVNEKFRSNRVWEHHNADIEPYFTIPVDGFREISEFTVYWYPDAENDVEHVDLTEIPLRIERFGSYREGLAEQTVTADLSGIMEQMMKTRVNESGRIPIDPRLPLPDGSVLYFTSFAYTVLDGTLDHITAGGYLLVP